jgi:hypothetical protein
MEIGLFPFKEYRVVVPKTKVCGGLAGSYRLQEMVWSRYHCYLIGISCFQNLRNWKAISSRKAYNWRTDVSTSGAGSWIRRVSQFLKWIHILHISIDRYVVEPWGSAILYWLIHTVIDWAVSRKLINKHVPRRSRVDAHCYATIVVLEFTAHGVTVTVESRYPRQWIVQKRSNGGKR